MTAVDRDAGRPGPADGRRRGHGPAADHARSQDLEAGDVDLGDGVFDLVLVTHYLHRPLMPALCGPWRSGGVLIYETFTVAQAARGRPTNPAYLLEPGELPQLVAPLEVMRSREGEVDGRDVASVVAVRR